MKETRLSRLLHGRDWGGAGLDNLVVVVEDDDNVRENFGYILKAERIRALVAADGMAGLALVRKHRPKVVVLDMYIPHMSGFEVIDEIRRDPILENIFVIGATGMASDSDDLHEMKGKADIILSKPIDEDHLIALIRKVFAETDDGQGLRRHLGGA